MGKLIDVSKLNEATVIYDKALRALPCIQLTDVAGALKLNMMELKGKHSIINERRHAGGTQAYKIGKELNYLEKLLGYEPSVIEPKDVIFITKENSQKYDDNELLVIGGQPVSNVTKKHPMEQKIVFALVKSHLEDMAYAIISAERDESASSPATACDGLFTKVDKLILAEEVNAARGNYAVSGTFDDPTSDTDYSAYENLVEWVGSANPYLLSDKGGIPQLILSQTVIKAARAALRNKLRQFAYPTAQELLNHLREDAFCPSLVFSTHMALGRGSRLVLQKVGNMDIAVNTQAASRFCQIRDIYEDPNMWQFWLQCGYDTRVRDWHEKVFRTNEQKNEALDLSGDYCQTGAIQIAMEGGDGVANLQGKTSTRTNGQYFLGLAPGEYTVEFGGVDGKTAESATVEVVAGEVVTATGTFSA